MKVKLSKCDFFFQYKSFDFTMYIGLDSLDVERKNIFTFYKYIYMKRSRKSTWCL